ncbi:hypothetical protein [Thermoactinomyces mirandus]|uniref:Helicase XPB/Ssl2 N-terminal domain-containing protein n=1 Tax=Thermoactinomyces mirandus TaxID=2756294 RepID=A0A7W1XSP6_9BACL|nr:hypothetical protein [Thermoactinomyces mirandus]MBA4602562.1 hypothetical protein [Thermoactinomyces mirandus]
MRITDWLTYTGIEQLKQMNRYYGCEIQRTHSKYELIRSLLQRIGNKSHLEEKIDRLNDQEFRFLQLIMLDQTPAYSMEELLAKGRIALNERQGQPRQLIVEALKRGWLFPGYSRQTQNLYYVPSDLRTQVCEILLKPYELEKNRRQIPPAVYRDEQKQLLYDLYHFLSFINKEIVRLTMDGAIYKNQQRQLFQTFYIKETPIAEKGPRFGFGRCYHLYPDRFSLLYDYAYYHRYFIEDENGYLCLTEEGKGKLEKKEKDSQGQDQGIEMVRFWIRLYKRAIPQLPMIIRWISLLAYPGWVKKSLVYQAVGPWMKAFYYESKESLYRKVLKMLVHLGVCMIGQEDDEQYLTLTPSGVKWLHGISAFRERAIEEGFVRNR